MGIPVLKLNLVPEPSLWRQHHRSISWAALGLGVASLLGVSGVTLWRYVQASRAGAAAVSLGVEARKAADQEKALTSQLAGIDVDTELPRWRLAERILQERATPWSRLAAEMEQSLVDGVRVKGVQRSRGSDNLVLLKLKGEARSQETEAAFVESLRTDPVFSQVNLERESQNPGGGWDFELNLPVPALLPPFEVRAAKPVAASGKTAQAPAPPPKPAPMVQSPAQAPAPAPVRREPLRERAVAPAVRPTPQRALPSRGGR
ncbi:MAG TPA: PilN domain-containing protein [Holophagaceae bacterium]|nr:PilN domain-containing protein [Holophagaceae bacterium]HJW09153.1 PilN domain-containing protein [Holophagaceae bacterium]